MRVARHREKVFMKLRSLFSLISGLALHASIVSRNYFYRETERDGWAERGGGGEKRGGQNGGYRGKARVKFKEGRRKESSESR